MKAFFATLVALLLLPINAQAGGLTGSGSTTVVYQGTSPWAVSSTQLPASLGQKIMAESLSCTISSDQSPVPVSQSGTWNINNVSGTISLPTGAATAARQDTGNASLASIDADTSTLITQTDTLESLLAAIDASILAFKAANHADLLGVQAKQDTGNASLATLVTQTDTIEASLGTLITQTDGVESSLSSIDADLDVALSTRASESTLSTLSAKIANNYGAATGAVRTASQIGNVSGAADFGAGTISAQTLRTTLASDQVLNLPTGASTAARQDTGNSSLANIDADTSTLITQTDGIEASLSSIDGKIVNSYGAATGAVRTASQIGNATAVADFNAGTTTAQTLRVVLPTDQSSIPSRTQDGSGNAISSTVEGGARGLDTHQRNTGIIISAGNSTTTPLGIGASFNAGGAGEDISRYPEITINLAGSPSVAPGTLYFEFSPDGTNWDVSVPTVLAGPNSLVPVPLRSVLPYFRVRYVNGGTALTQLRLTTVYHWQFSSDLTRVLNQSIDENEPVKNVRAFVGGKSPDGPYKNLPATGEVASQSTMTPLGIGATFNAAGPVIDMSGYVAAGVTIKSDVNSAVNGVVFHWYDTIAATNELKISNFTYGSAPSGGTVQVPRQGPFLRITYTNGGVAQTSFSMASRLFVTAPPSDVLAISETITGNTAAQIVKSHNVGLQENGVYANVGLSNIGSIKVALADRTSEVRNRTFVDASIDYTALVVSPGTLIYTVTGGKTFYLLDYTVSCVNQTNAVGRWILADNTTRKFGFSIPQQAVGAAASSGAASPTFLDPPRFTTSVRAIEVTGDVSCYITIHGYEE